MAEDKRQPDDLTPEDLEALQKELESRAAEDKFFGEENALTTAEELDQDGQLKIDQIRRGMQRSVEEKVEGPKAQTAEALIDKLQERDEIRMSIHTPTLVKFLDYLGGRLGLRVKIGEDTLYASNPKAIEISPTNLDRFLARGAIAGTFLAALMISPQAIAQEFQPGMDIFNDPGFTAVTGSPTEDVWNLEYVAALLLLLGLSTYGVYRLIKWYKKQKPYKEKAKEVKKYYEEYEEAVNTGDEDRIAEAKNRLATSMMAELPTTLEGIDLGEDVKIDKKDIEKALGWKQQVDMTISEVTLDIEKAMVLPKKPTIKNINKKKAEVYDLISAKVKQIYALYDELGKALNGLDLDRYAYLWQQLKFEKQKLDYYLKYLDLMKKKWLVLIQNAKNEIIHSTSYTKLSAGDKIQQEVIKLKESLSNLLDAQATTDPDQFKDLLTKIEAELDTQTRAGAEQGVTGLQQEAVEQVNHDFIQIFNNGNFNHQTPIRYQINGNDEKIINLNEDFAVQIWINTDQSIQMNLNFKSNLVETKTLQVGVNGNFHLKENDQPLEDYLSEKQGDTNILGLEAAAVDLGAEAEPVLNQLAAHIAAVNEQIKNGSYQMFGRKVESDDDAIEYHTIKVHKEHFKGKPITVARFTLSEKYWKKALAGLANQDDIPKHTVFFNYENPQGGKMSVNQEMRRFNVITNGKQATVLIPSTEKLRALSGEVRVIFDPKVEYSLEEIKTIFAEVAKRLGIVKHLKPVTPASRAKEQARLKDIRKEGHDPAGSKAGIHPEYDAEGVKLDSVQELKSKGLHSVYHQFSGGVLEKMFKAGHLFATTTRWAKGEMESGMSSAADMVDGGATEVFTRIHTKKSAKGGQWYTHGKPALVFPPEVFERMDCYCYTSDRYGSKKPGTFSQRVSPKKLVEIMNVSYNSGNEVMFHDAMKVQDAAYLVCDDPKGYIKRLKSMGINQLGGKSLEQAVITPSQFSQLDHI